ncbi:MAG: hypothetical protein AB7V43_15625, partial [Acidimicrobiia bacterium]
SIRVAERPSSDLWSVEKVCHTALSSYSRDHRIVFGWAGPCPPEGLPAGVDVVEQPPFLSLWEARQWVVRELADGAPETEPVYLVDRDVVVAPDTIEMMATDWDLLSDQQPPIGMLVCRSNHAPPGQDIRVARDSQYLGAGRGFTSESEVVGRSVVEVNAALIRRDVLAAVRAPWFDEMSDEVVAIDLLLAGLANVVSRAYVHRNPRQRLMLGGSDDLSFSADGLEFLGRTRPDLRELIDDPPPPCPAPDVALEEEWPDEAYRRWCAQPESRMRTVGMARCLRWIGRSVEAAQLLAALEVESLSDAELELTADVARAIGDLDWALSLYRSRPQGFSRAERELSGLIDRYTKDLVARDVNA